MVLSLGGSRQMGMTKAWSMSAWHRAATKNGAGLKYELAVKKEELASPDWPGQKSTSHRIL